jgi:NAD-dependent SIR2 family protein deacetylase
MTASRSCAAGPERLDASEGPRAFVYTSNVDGQFQKAGFDAEQVHEVHGSIHHLQCSRPCNETIFAAGATTVDIDEQSMRARAPLPTCPDCGALARPNVLMFGDFGWLGDRSSRQDARLHAYQRRIAGGKLAIIECGAGTSVPTVRWHCEQTVQRDGATLIRINPREPEGPQGTISIAAGAKEAIDAIDALLPA